MAAKSIFIASTVGVSVLLQGCGSGGGGSGGDSSGPTPAPTPRPTPAPPKHTVFWDALNSKEAADMFNKAYMGFDEKDDNSPLGVTISMAGQPSTFYGNIYCSKFVNPVTGNRTGCYNGNTECRMSASLYNHKMLVMNDTGKINMGLKRPTGFVFNQTLVENYFGKCSYIWDGASNNKYNTGCGDGASGSCKDKFSAFSDICPSTNQTCTANDTEVKRGLCHDFGGPPEMKYPPTHNGQKMCAIPGASFNYHGQDDWTPAPSNLRTMAKVRVGFNGGSDIEGSNIEKWNEIVIDEHLLMPRIQFDPPTAIIAIVYTPASSRVLATQMRDEYCKVNKLTGKKCIPIVGIDANKGKTEGPFFEDKTNDEAREEIVI